MKEEDQPRRRPGAAPPGFFQGREAMLGEDDVRMSIAGGSNAPKAECGAFSKEHGVEPSGRRLTTYVREATAFFRVSKARQTAFVPKGDECDGELLRWDYPYPSWKVEGGVASDPSVFTF